MNINTIDQSSIPQGSSNKYPIREEIDDVGLSPAAFMVYVRLASMTYFSESGEFATTLQFLADNCQMSRNSAKRALAELKRFKVINRPSLHEVRGTIVQDPSLWDWSQGELKPKPAKTVRQQVYESNSHTCVYCGSQENLSLDHVIPLCQGGADDISNLVTCCLKCNVEKGGKTPREWMQKLASKQRHS